MLEGRPRGGNACPYRLVESRNKGGRRRSRSVLFKKGKRVRCGRKDDIGKREEGQLFPIFQFLEGPVASILDFFTRQMRTAPSKFKMRVECGLDLTISCFYSHRNGET